MGRGAGYEGAREDRVPWGSGSRALAGVGWGHAGEAEAQGNRTGTHTGVDALAHCIRVQRVDVLIRRTANQIIGAVPGDFGDPGGEHSGAWSAQMAEVEGGWREGACGSRDQVARQAETGL